MVEVKITARLLSFFNVEMERLGSSGGSISQLPAVPERGGEQLPAESQHVVNEGSEPLGPEAVGRLLHQLFFLINSVGTNSGSPLTFFCSYRSAECLPYLFQLFPVSVS